MKFKGNEVKIKNIRVHSLTQPPRVTSSHDRCQCPFRWPSCPVHPYPPPAAAMSIGYSSFTRPTYEVSISLQNIPIPTKNSEKINLKRLGEFIKSWTHSERDPSQTSMDHLPSMSLGSNYWAWCLQELDQFRVSAQEPMRSLFIPFFPNSQAL